MADYDQNYIPYLIESIIGEGRRIIFLFSNYESATSCSNLNTWYHLHDSQNTEQNVIANFVISSSLDLYFQLDSSSVSCRSHWLL